MASGTGRVQQSATVADRHDANMSGSSLAAAYLSSIR